MCRSSGRTLRLPVGFRRPCFGMLPLLLASLLFLPFARLSGPWLFPSNFSAFRLLIICFHADFESECHGPRPACRERSAAQIYTPPPACHPSAGDHGDEHPDNTDEIGLGPAGITAYFDTSLLPPGTFVGSAGSFPYLVVSDQDVSDPSTIPDRPDPSGGFPIRVDGWFNWPGISWNQPDQAFLTGRCPGMFTTCTRSELSSRFRPGLFNPQDPTVLVQWTVTRPDTNAIVLSKTGGFGQRGPGNIFAVSIDHGSASLQSADQFLVTCKLFRPLASGGTEQFFSGGNLFIHCRSF